MPKGKGPDWLVESFTSSVSGVNSGVEPDLISASSLAWGYNIKNRGGRPSTRPYFKFRMQLPRGRIQGASYFGIQRGMGVLMVAGHLFRLNIGGIEANNDTYEEIALGFPNYPLAKKVWMTQTVESLVIQNLIDDALIYDGSTAERSRPSEGGVPRGKQMAYGNGRLWVAVDERTLVAGDIRTNDKGSELKFTETDYLSGGGSFTFSDGISALGFIPTTGTSDYGALMVFGKDSVNSIRADVTSRDSWSSYPSFITNILRNSGAAGQSSLTEVNQDLYWRDSMGGIRSVRAGLSDESGDGNAPVSWEVSRLTDYDSRELLEDCPAMMFNNRLLIGSSPFLNFYGDTSWKSIIALDFVPVASMATKAPPEYDGEWAGLSITHMFAGKFNGVHRGFMVACSDDGVNSLWEVMPDSNAYISDWIEQCDGEGITPSRVTQYFETARRDFGNINHKKALRRVDVYLADLLGTVDMEVFWRTDNNQVWRSLGTQQFCANTDDPEVEGETSHIWKNIGSQQRLQRKSLGIVPTQDVISKYALHVGFQFQFRVVITGNAKVMRVVAHAEAVNEEQYAMHRYDDSDCVTNDIT